MDLQPWMTFLSGATCALYCVAALLLLRFYGKSRDRLFACFSAAFAILAASRILFLLLGVPDEARTTLYAVRLAAFALIIFGIIDKNLQHRTKQR